MLYSSVPILYNVLRVSEVAEGDLGEGSKPEPDTRLLCFPNGVREMSDSDESCGRRALLLSLFIPVQPPSIFI